MTTQKTRDSVIYWIGLITVIIQGVLGVLMEMGLVTADMVGAIMSAFALILGWCNGNNPNIAGTYRPTVRK